MAKNTHMIGPGGESVPVAWVPAYDKLRDRKVRQVVKLYQAERERLEELMVKSLAVVQEIMQARGNGIAERGNFQVSSFDNLMRIEIVTRYKIELDDRALKAKQMMLEHFNQCLTEVSKSEERIAMLQMITDTFTPTRGGALRANMVVRLLTYNFKSKLWQDACAILRQAMQTNRVKSYINVSTRGTHQDEWSVIRLDIADCWPEGFVVE